MDDAKSFWKLLFFAKKKANISLIWCKKFIIVHIFFWFDFHEKNVEIKFFHLFWRCLMLHTNSFSSLLLMNEKWTHESWLRSTLLTFNLWRTDIDINIKQSCCLEQNISRYCRPFSCILNFFQSISNISVFANAGTDKLVGNTGKVYKHKFDYSVF